LFSAFVDGRVLSTPTDGTRLIKSRAIVMLRTSSGIVSLLACAALVLLCSFWQQAWPEQVLTESRHFGRRAAEAHEQIGKTQIVKLGSSKGEPKPHDESEHQGEAEGEGEGKGESEGESGWSAANLIAIMLMIFLFMIVFFVYLVFFNDPDIRKAMYTMLSTTMSIFIAVVINTAAFGFFLEQVIAGKGWNHWGPIWFPRGLATFTVIGVYGEFVVSVMLFFCCEFAMNLLCVLAGSNEDARCAVRVIGGHLMAFAGIITFGTMQIKAEQFGPMGRHHYVVVGLCILIISAFRFIFGCVFDSWFDKYGEGARSLLSDPTYQPTTEDKEKRTELSKAIKAEINEGENDAVSLIIGFLFTQTAVWKVTGHLMPLHVPRGSRQALHSQSEITCMLWMFVGALGVLSVASFAEYTISKNADLQSVVSSEDSGSWKATVFNCALLCSLMATSWIALVTSTWQVHEWFSGTPLGSHEMAEVATAFLLTIASVGFILILDRWADKMKPKADPGKSRTPRGADDESVGDAQTVAIAAGRLWSQADEAKEKLIEAQIKAIETMVRKWIEAFGLLVGLSWEKACHGAVDTMIESTPILAEHMVISKLLLAVVLAAYILPAWLIHIMPMANKSVQDHQTAIHLSQIHRLHREGKLKEYLDDPKHEGHKKEFLDIISELKDQLNGKKARSRRPSHNVSVPELVCSAMSAS